MSGLIVKDLELIRVNIKIYLAVFAIGVVYLIAKKDSAAFFTSYMIVMSVGLSAGTVSYDSYEKRMNFLMTLPVTRKQYVYHTKNRCCFISGWNYESAAFRKWHGGRYSGRNSCGIVCGRSASGTCDSAAHKI